MRKSSVLAAALGFALLCSTPTFAANTRLLETGSSLLYPLMNLWVAGYQKDHHGVQITTQSTGSGTGISQAISGVAQIGASDAYMSDGQIAQSKMLNIPLAISAQQINYNLPGLNNVHLNLSGPVIAGIYSGTIHDWDDAAIKAINAKYANRLPHHAIIPIHRSDGSGDTFIFTQYLSFSTPSWKSGPSFGTTISWPGVSNAVGANGNPGMVQTCKDTPYSIAYIGVSFLNQTDAAHLGYAALKNRAGKFVLPTATTIHAAASTLVSKTPRDERISLVFAPGENSYPIINYEYAIVNPQQPASATRSALVDFLKWTVGDGNNSQYLSAVHFLPLPAGVRHLSEEQLGDIR